MCGICGKLSWESAPSTALVQRMSRALAHRGPDAEGIEALDQIALGHRRLAIIDLSSLAHQPMSDVERKYWIVFNGEIYNFVEIKDELLQRGVQFRSKSDTEVILEAYRCWGLDCVKKFNGMFAFALWDVSSQRLILARDRLGKKPLYYYLFPDGGVSFASELKALLEDPAIPRRINPVALNHYLSLNYTLTAECIIEGVHKLPGANTLVLDRGKPPRQTCYWNLADSFANKRSFRSESDAASELREYVDDAVRLRLISDVPLGVFLSGGVDSSAIAASMCRFRRPGEVCSFSAGFKEKSYNEIDEARYVASALGVHHRDTIVEEDVANLIGRMVYFADEPFADTSMMPMYLLSEFSRKHVTVCLSGDGGDEVFAGYETYAADKIHHLTRWIPGWLSKSMYHAFSRLWPVTFDKVSFDYKVRQFLQGHALEAPGAHYYWRTIFSTDEKRRLLRGVFHDILDSDPSDHFLAFDKEVAQCHYLDRGMYVDIKTWLVDDILVKVDRTSMAHGLEARAPLLDYRLVEYAASLPVHLKMKFFQKKYLFKKSQEGRIPRRAIRRPKKGFNSPFSHWLATTLRDSGYELTVKSTLAQSIFNTNYVATLWDEHLSKKQDHGLKLFGVLNFLTWCELYKAEIGSAR